MIRSGSSSWFGVTTPFAQVLSAELGIPFERIRLSAGIAELRPEDDAKTFFERADEALYRAKETGKGRFSAANGVG